jgi:predicted RNA-binding Zn-ribbon protein involved in translation (DUF1610 family)
MIPYRIECDDCGEPRIARQKNDDLVPVPRVCPNCGSEAFVVSYHDSE